MVQLEKNVSYVDLDKGLATGFLFSIPYSSRIAASQIRYVRDKTWMGQRRWVTKLIPNAISTVSAHAQLWNSPGRKRRANFVTRHWRNSVTTSATASHTSENTLENKGRNYALYCLARKLLSWLVTS